MGQGLPEARAGAVWLGDMDLGKVRQGWGKAQKDKGVAGGPLSAGGKVYARGLGTHASGRIWVNLQGATERFRGLVAVDDVQGKGKGSVQFKVFGDGKALFESDVLRSGDEPKPFDIDVHGMRELLLVSDDGGDGVAFDHADWLEARFEGEGPAPVLVDAPYEPTIVLTPLPSPKPRVNGARVFGVRPGSPLLFTIAATGQRPLVFKATGLPAGVSLDPATGRLGGAVAKAGTYKVKVRVTNAHGAAESTLRIVCGDTLALTPHMGWNSWYVWENHVTDKIMRGAADAMVASGMADHGYSYVNIDDCWAVKPGATDPSLAGELRDARGYVNANGRFPDMKGLADYIHSRGLKAGIYTSPGKTTCAGHVGALGFEEQDVARFVEWGFDFLKYDWCSYGDVAPNPDRAALQKPYRLISEILRRQPRDLILNLCQYGMGNVWEWGKEVGGHSWRTAGDLGGSFEGIGSALFRDGFDVYAQNQLHRYGGPGAWNDPDYLLLGYLSNWNGQTVPTPLTPNEQYTHVSLWSLLAAPLIFSGDIARMDDFTFSLLTNDEVIDIDQDPLGRPGYRVRKTGDLEVWARPLEDGSQAVGLFNRGEFKSNVSVKWSELGLRRKGRVRDLWRQQDIGVFADGYSADVGRHGVVLLRVWPAKR